MRSLSEQLMGQGGVTQLLLIVAALHVAMGVMMLLSYGIGRYLDRADRLCLKHFGRLPSERARTLLLALAILGWPRFLGRL